MSAILPVRPSARTGCPLRKGCARPGTSIMVGMPSSGRKMTGGGGTQARVLAGAQPKLVHLLRWLLPHGVFANLINRANGGK